MTYTTVLVFVVSISTSFFFQTKVHQYFFLDFHRVTLSRSGFSSRDLIMLCMCHARRSKCGGVYSFAFISNYNRNYSYYTIMTKLVIHNLLLLIGVLHVCCLQTEIFYKIRDLVHKHQHSIQARHDPVYEYTIQQPLDHFEPSQKTFMQRYWVNSNYWRKNDGPVFLYIGGESEMSASFIDGGKVYVL